MEKKLEIQKWEGSCHRCGLPSASHILSFLNADLLCLNCCQVEKSHPNFEAARAAEAAALRAGNSNFLEDFSHISRHCPTLPDVSRHEEG